MKLNRRKYCECGCGTRISSSKRFVSGHNGRVAHGMTGKHHLESSKKAMSVGHLGMDTWNKGLVGAQVNPRKGLTGFKSGMEGKRHKKESKAAMRESKLISWQDPAYVEKICAARAIKPNKPETVILDMLNKMYPGEYKYTGDFSFMINGKNPDFVNCNGQKKCIELFGDYFHKGQDPEDRKEIFKPFGYDTLVIWEHELKKKSLLKLKIHRFHRKENTVGECHA